MKIFTNSPQETEALGKNLGRCMEDEGLTLALLYGEMGAGKTALVRGFCSELSPLSRVKSPTYTIVNEYRRGRVPIFHFDLCRLSSADELDSFGFEEYLSEGICIIEWPDILGDFLPENAVNLTFTKSGEQGRIIAVEGLSHGAEEKLRLLCGEEDMEIEG